MVAKATAEALRQLPKRSDAARQGARARQQPF
jgi:3-methyladenine DNA glycosylase AlkD